MPGPIILLFIVKQELFWAVTRCFDCKVNFKKICRTMRAPKVFILLAAIAIYVYSPIQHVEAQPSPEELATEIEQEYEEWLQNIETLTVTTESVNGGFIPATTTDFIKVAEGDRVWLKAEDGETGIQTGVMFGAPEDEEIHIRHATSIYEETLDGYSVYEVVIDDADILAKTMEVDTDVTGEDPTTLKTTYWIDRDDLIMRKVLIKQEDNNGNEVLTEVRMEDYQYHEGFPIAHTVTMDIDGLEHQISEAELEEAREGMKEMEEQMEQMPEAQRRMIEEQVEEVMERFGAMLATGELGKMHFEVTEVKVNE